jgi:acetylornithine deacetylase
VHGALSRELHEWRPPQVADFAKMTGTARYAPSQSEASVLADLRRLCDELERETPGLRATVARSALGNRPVMLPFEVSRDARIVQIMRETYRKVRGAEQPVGPVRP